MPSSFRPVEELYRQAVNEQILVLGEAVASFECADFGEYALACGRIRGMREALHLLREAEITTVRAEEDEEAHGS